MMKRIFLLLPLTFCFAFSFSQSITRPATISTQGGNSPWTATAGISEAIKSNDGVYLRADLGANQTSGTLNLTGFGFGIPTTASINGITVSIKKHAGASGHIIDNTIRLLIAGVQSGENKASAASWATSDVVIKYGASNNKWTLTGLTASQINSPSFGVSIQVLNGASSGAAFIDQVTITVSYNTGSQLPVRFVGFSSKKVASGMQLTWRVHEEDKLLRYEIERSNNGIKFEKIAVVPAKAQEEYSYIDLNPISGKSFYRIKGVDIDSKFGYSTVLFLNAGNSEIVFKAFPTLVQNQITVQHDPATADTRLIISNQDGRIVRNINPVKASIETTIDLSALGSGMYLLKFINGSGAIETRKFLKQ